jgi:hypothetical protein
MICPLAPADRPAARPAVSPAPAEHLLRWTTTALLTGQRWVRGGLDRSAARGDRGDVNGYVFVTLMTAGIVMVIWVVARDRLTTLFERAISSVTGP